MTDELLNAARDPEVLLCNEGKWAAYHAERDGFDGSEVHNHYRSQIQERP